MTRRSMYLVYFKAEWDFINNLTSFHGIQVPPDAPMENSFLSLLSLVTKRDPLSLSLSEELRCVALPPRPQEILPPLPKKGIPKNQLYPRISRTSTWRQKPLTSSCYLGSPISLISSILHLKTDPVAWLIPHLSGGGVGQNGPYVTQSAAHFLGSADIDERKLYVSP